MRMLKLVGANDESVIAAERRVLNGHYDELLSDFRQRMDTALQALREYEEAVRQGEYF